jgi:hypothetical protein
MGMAVFSAGWMGRHGRLPVLFMKKIQGRKFKAVRFVME